MNHTAKTSVVGKDLDDDACACSGRRRLIIRCWWQLCQEPETTSKAAITVHNEFGANIHCEPKTCHSRLTHNIGNDFKNPIIVGLGNKLATIFPIA